MLTLREFLVGKAEDHLLDLRELVHAVDALGVLAVSPGFATKAR